MSIRFYRQEYGSGLPFPTPGDLPNPGIGPASLGSPHRQADLLSQPPGKLSALTRSHIILTAKFLYYIYIR